MGPSLAPLSDSSDLFHRARLWVGFQSEKECHYFNRSLQTTNSKIRRSKSKVPLLGGRYSMRPLSPPVISIKHLLKMWHPRHLKPQVRVQEISEADCPNTSISEATEEGRALAKALHLVDVKSIQSFL